MPFSEVYQRQVALLIRTLPHIATEACFALKGGTAINLFVRDMPRLSVDIDLTYVPIAPRSESLAAIDVAMKRIAKRIRGALRGSSVAETALREERIVNKLVVRTGDVQVKIEVTPVLRGCVFEPQVMSVSPAVEDAYGFAEMLTVSFADLYGGKIVAALDRQHPRDLFDIHDLLRNEGIDGDLRTAFVAYLLMHNRPMHEVLGSTQRDIEEEFTRGFAGMTREDVALPVLLGARERLVQKIVGAMPQHHRRFLLSFERGEPEWALLGKDDLPALPAVEWRQRNLAAIGKDRRAALVEALEHVLSQATEP